VSRRGAPRGRPYQSFQDYLTRAVDDFEWRLVAFERVTTTRWRGATRRFVAARTTWDFFALLTRWLLVRWLAVATVREREVPRFTALTALVLREREVLATRADREPRERETREERTRETRAREAVSWVDRATWMSGRASPEATYWR